VEGDKLTFNITASKLSKWHRYAHLGQYPRPASCMFCNREMFKIAGWLRKRGYSIIRTGPNFLTFEMRLNIRQGPFGMTSEEVDRLYVNVAGFEEKDCPGCGQFMPIHHEGRSLYYMCSNGCDERVYIRGE